MSRSSRRRSRGSTAARRRWHPFSRNSRIAETVARAEYGLKIGKNDWQVSLERAFNSLDQRGALVRARSRRRIRRSAFPEGSGKVQELRYEGIGTWSRPLSAEARPASRRRGRDFDARAGRWRPAGAQVLPPQGQRHAWLAAGQGMGREPQAAPPGRADQLLRFPGPAQSAARTARIAATPTSSRRKAGRSRPRSARELGAWGKTRLKLYAHKIDDIIDIIPIGEDRRRRRQSAARDPVRRRNRPARCCSIRSAGRAPRSTSLRVREDQRARSADRREAADQRHARPLGRSRSPRHPGQQDRLGRGPTTTIMPRTIS